MWGSETEKSRRRTHLTPCFYLFSESELNLAQIQKDTASILDIRIADSDFISAEALRLILGLAFWQSETQFIKIEGVLTLSGLQTKSHT